MAIIAFKNETNSLLINILTLSDMTSEIPQNPGGPKRQPLEIIKGASQVTGQCCPQLKVAFQSCKLLQNLLLDILRMLLEIFPMLLDIFRHIFADFGHHVDQLWQILTILLGKGPKKNYESL